MTKGPLPSAPPLAPTAHRRLSDWPDAKTQCWCEFGCSSPYKLACIKGLGVSGSSTPGTRLPSLGYKTAQR